VSGSLQVVLAVEGGVDIITLAGDFDLATSDAFLQAVAPLLRKGGRITVDMGSVRYMSSAGLRAMLSTHRHVAELEARMILAAVSDEVRDVMAMTGFLGRFVLHQTLREALEALREPEV
jgi:anti-sigma B factor antagonist